MLGKCLLEGVSTGIELAPIVYAALLGQEADVLSEPELALAHLAAWDKADAARLRSLLLRRLGTGNDPSLTIGGLLGNGDAALLSDYNKRDVICKYAAKKLVDRRRDAMDSISRGFSAVMDAVGLSSAVHSLNDLELGALLFGSEVVNVEALKARRPSGTRARGLGAAAAALAVCATTTHRAAQHA